MVMIMVWCWYLVGDDRIRGDERRALHEVLSEILQADLKVKLTAASDDVLTGLHVCIYVCMGIGQRDVMLYIMRDMTYKYTISIMYICIHI